MYFPFGPGIVVGTVRGGGHMFELLAEEVGGEAGVDPPGPGEGWVGAQAIDELARNGVGVEYWLSGFEVSVLLLGLVLGGIDWNIEVKVLGGGGEDFSLTITYISRGKTIAFVGNVARTLPRDRHLHRILRSIGFATSDLRPPLLRMASRFVQKARQVGSRIQRSHMGTWDQVVPSYLHLRILLALASEDLLLFGREVGEKPPILTLAQRTFSTW